ncbi:MauE/DoxX family redox-associated membrane protein [Pedobacter sp. 22226]|uniref:MauE/DoxX family redox-associated membrane protein n=1 Tax=Pedobacter sp. 22226 TaxID=3453894 RepID=UPI003F876AA8
MNLPAAKQLLLKTICALLILLWVYTSLSKLSELHEFRAQLNNQISGKKLAPYLIWFLPGIELLAAGMLLLKELQKPGLILSAALMAAFTTYVALVVLDVFDRIPCSCGGVLKNLGWNAHLVFNLFFLLLSLWGIYITRNKGMGEQAQ